MLPTCPNKEVVRRLSILLNANYCYLLIIPDDPFIHILSDIANKDLNNYSSELKTWCGMKFRVHNESDEKEVIQNMMKKGEKILPITHLEIKKAEKNLGL